MVQKEDLKEKLERESTALGIDFAFVQSKQGSDKQGRGGGHLRDPTILAKKMSGIAPRAWGQIQQEGSVDKGLKRKNRVQGDCRGRLCKGRYLRSGGMK